MMLEDASILADTTYICVMLVGGDPINAIDFKLSANGDPAVLLTLLHAAAARITKDMLEEKQLRDQDKDTMSNA